MELEKKKKTITKPVIKGPIIRYHSVSMPLVEDEEENNDLELEDVDSQTNTNTGESAEQEADKTTTNEKKEKEEKKQSRNFIIFSDEQTMRSIFPGRKPVKPDVTKKICPVTGLPAKYFDPVTQKPYANLFAFKVLREMHAKKEPIVI